jgi:membrane-bound serine protease (ClpP class)
MSKKLLSRPTCTSIFVTGTIQYSGTIIIEDERIDAVSEGAYIDKGSNVKVVKVEGVRIVVRAVTNLDK